MVVTKPKRLVLIDGDILCFRTAATCETRSVEVKHNKSGRIKIFKNKTEFKSYLKDKKFDYVPDDYIFTDVQTLNEEISYQFLLKNQMESLQKMLWWDEVKILVDGGDNFRAKLPLPTRYKGNRDGTLTPLLRKECKSYLISKYKAEEVRGCETDDALIYIGYEYLNKGYEVIIVTNDKDANAYSGLKLYNYTKDNPEIVPIPKLGALWLDDKDEVRGLGFMWYCMQMICGDGSDGYKPTDLCETKTSFGSKSAYKLLKDCTSEQQALDLVIRQYETWYPKKFNYTDCFGVLHKNQTAQDILQLYHSCVRMKETPNDNLNFNIFSAKVQLDEIKKGNL